jgi:predicted Fe-Mo cluster-binding NifX family protein
MKIAVPLTENKQIDDHFGHCEYYGVYTVSDSKEITDMQILPSPQGCGCKSNIAMELAGDGVTVMLAGGMGEGAVNVLGNFGIKVIRGCSGDATEVVKMFISGNLTDSGISCMQHKHHNGEGHSCHND